MRKLSQATHTVSEFLDKLVTWFVFAIIVAMIIITTLQIIFRVFFTALSWSEESTRYLLVWATFFAATLAYKRGKHVAVTFVVEKFPLRVQKYIHLIGLILSAVFFLVVVFFSLQVIDAQIYQTSPAMGLEMKWVYVAMPISHVILMVHALCFAFDLFIPHSQEVSA